MNTFNTTNATTVDAIVSPVTKLDRAMVKTFRRTQVAGQALTGVTTAATVGFSIGAASGFKRALELNGIKMPSFFSDDNNEEAIIDGVAAAIIS